MKVTIGISFVNNATTLGDAVRSVFAQTFRDWELILLDDGSTDGSWSIACAIKDRRVSALRNGNNIGVSASWNRIAEIARGKYIAHMDADDMMHPLRIEKQVRWLDKRPDVDVLDTAMCTIDSQNRPFGIRGCDGLAVTPQRCLANGLLNQPTILARTAWRRRYKYEALRRRAEDYELWCRAMINGDCRFARLPEPLLFYREEGSITLRKVLSTNASVRETMRRYGPHLVGVPQTWKYLVQSYLKSTAWVFASACGIPHVIYQRRNRALSEENRRRANRVIQSILRTDVPGLEPVTACSSED